MKHLGTGYVVRIAIAAILLGCAVVGLAQTSEEYLKLRRQHKITQAAGVEALQTLIGSRVLEIKGTVKGVIGANGSSMLLLDAGYDVVSVKAERFPDWIATGGPLVRLIVKAKREQEYLPLEATLIAATMERTVAEVEAKAAAAKKPARGSAPASRGGNIGLSGPIGKTKAPATPPKNWQLEASDALPYYVAFIQKRNRKLSDREATRIAEGIIGFSIKYGVDARLIMAMVLVESGFNPSATSKAGAMGLGQLMPGTAKGMGVNNAYDSIENLYGTVRLVRGHLEKYHKQTGGDGYESLVLTLAAYNAGSGAVRRHGGVPPYKETQRYIEKVISTFKQLRGY